MNKNVTVIIAAGSGVGKSTITSVIKNALEEAGIDVEYNPNAHDPLPDKELTQKRLDSLKEHDLSVEILEHQMNRRSSEDTGAEAKIDAVFNAINDVHSYFGYVEDWVAIPLEDGRKYVWFVDEEAGFVRFAEDAKNLDDVDAGHYYENEIYTQRFLPKFVYRTDDFTMISVDTHTDGNKFLQIFDNKKEIKE